MHMYPMSIETTAAKLGNLGVEIAVLLLVLGLLAYLGNRRAGAALITTAVVVGVISATVAQDPGAIKDAFHEIGRGLLGIVVDLAKAFVS